MIFQGFRGACDSCMLLKRPLQIFQRPLQFLLFRKRRPNLAFQFATRNDDVFNLVIGTQRIAFLLRAFLGVLDTSCTACR